MIATDAQAVLEIDGMTVKYPGQYALRDVSLRVCAGEIHALLGENGSGKSTLIKALAGLARSNPDARVEVNGAQLELGSRRSADELGLRFVHQDLGLVLELDAVDNLALGQGYQHLRRGAIHWRSERIEAVRALRELGHDFDVRRPVDELAMSERTAIAIARALSGRNGPPRVLFLDEPTANLHEAEVVRLLDLMRTVAASGVPVVWVSHYLPEVLAVADRATILRNGQIVASRAISESSLHDLTDLLVGEQGDVSESTLIAQSKRDVAIAVVDVSGGGVKELSLTLRKGEIFGVAGIAGSGRESVGPCLFGDVPRSGTVHVSGEVLPAGKPWRSVRAGIAYVPADRHVSAAFMTHTAEENINLGRLAATAGPHLLRGKRQQEIAVEWMARLQVRPELPQQEMSKFSGGNQQKIALARALSLHPDLLLLDNPTQGVDVNARAEIHRLIATAAGEGLAVLVASTDHDELAGLCDSVLVMRGGRVAAQIAGPQLNAESLTRATQS
jgi:ribose transport system ATP-binding protein